MDALSAYTLLSKLLLDSSVSIEIIPGDGQEWQAAIPIESQKNAPFLFTDGNLGVPQKSLYQVYMVAVRRFSPATLRSVLLSHDEQVSADLISATSIIILANPAHTTALNARKRLIFAGLLDGRRDLEFFAALIGIKEVAKQEAIWHHRRWIIHHIYEGYNEVALGSWDTDDSSVIHAPHECWQKELALAARACEVYPRNYHAWTHRLLCAQALVRACCQSLIPQDDLESFLRDEIQATKLWIELHISDHSAVHYLLHLLRVSHDVDGTIHISYPEEHRRMALDHAASLVHTYPTHEALWLYLKGCIDVCAEGQKAGSGVHEDSILAAAEALIGKFASADSDASIYAGRLKRWRDDTLYVSRNISEKVSGGADSRLL